MRDQLQSLCVSFLQNRDVIKRRFRMESSYLYPVCANIFCARGIPAEDDSLVRCRDLLKEKVGVFSNFRGNLTVPIISMLASGPNPEGRIDQAIENYAALKDRFFGSQYLALAAFLLADMGVGRRAAEHVDRGRALYDRMKKEHPFLTSAEDSVFAVLMAFSDKSDEDLLDDMERCYRHLKTRFSSGNAAQSASHVLSFAPGDPEKKTDRLIAIYDGLRSAGAKYGKHEQLSTLASVSILDVETDQIVRDILDVDLWLSGQKGYGFLSVDRKRRLMHAAMLVSDDYCTQDARFQAILSGDYADAAAQTAAQSAVMTSTLAMLAAQQAALCASITASSTAAAAAANS